MKKRCYQFNPERFVQYYKNWTLMERAILRGVLDMIWRSENQYSIDACPECIARELGCSISEVTAVLVKIENNGNELLSIVNLIASNSDKAVLSEYFKDQIKESHSNDCLEDRAASYLRRKISQTLKATIAEEVRLPETATAKYVENPLLLSGYEGLLPTHNFNKHGQVYVVTDELLKHLLDNYPSLDARSELSRIFEWLIGSVDRRPTVANMFSFINRWFQSALKRNELAATELDDLDSQLSKMIEDMQ